MTHSQTNPTHRDAAKFLIEVANQGNGVVTALSIQKLLYFAHGLMLAKHQQPLIAGIQFQAWKYGPVIESLYYDLKFFGSMSIKAESYFVKEWPSNLSENAQNCIRSVWNQFKDSPASKLVNISHDPNGPWADVYNNTTLGIEIEDTKIQEYFITKLTTPNAA